MSRGKKLDIFIGANIEDGWSKSQEILKEELKIVEPSKHWLHFAKEKRNAKVVTLIGEFFINDSDAKELLAKIKKRLGCGGTYKDGFMEFQGELQTKLKPLIEESGFRFKS